MCHSLLNLCIQRCSDYRRWLLLCRMQNLLKCAQAAELAWLSTSPVLSLVGIYMWWPLLWRPEVSSSHLASGWVPTTSRMDFHYTQRAWRSQGIVSFLYPHSVQPLFSDSHPQVIRLSPSPQKTQGRRLYSIWWNWNLACRNRGEWVAFWDNPMRLSTAACNVLPAFVPYWQLILVGTAIVCVLMAEVTS